MSNHLPMIASVLAGVRRRPIRHLARHRPPPSPPHPHQLGARRDPLTGLLNRTGLTEAQPPGN